MADLLKKLLGGKKENYGRVRLDWGQYPIHELNDMGGCHGDEGSALPDVDPQAAARTAHAMQNMTQRGGNNPYQFENCPERLKYEVGTGCMNPACHCPNCQGDCHCAAGMAHKSKMLQALKAKMSAGPRLMGKPVTFWLVVGVLAYLLYRNRGAIRRALRR